MTGRIIHELRWLRDLLRRIEYAMLDDVLLSRWNRSMVARIRKNRQIPSPTPRDIRELSWLLLALQRIRIALRDGSGFLAHWRRWVVEHIALLEADHDKAIQRMRERLKERKRSGYA